MKARGERLFVRGGQMARGGGAGYVGLNDVVWIPYFQSGLHTRPASLSAYINSACTE
jgi:hypothetical protein